MQVCSNGKCSLTIDGSNTINPITKEWVSGKPSTHLDVTTDKNGKITATYFDEQMILEPYVESKDKNSKSKIDKVELKNKDNGIEFITTLSDASLTSEIGFRISGNYSHISIDNSDLDANNFTYAFNASVLKITNPTKEIIDPTLTISGGIYELCGSDTTNTLVEIINGGQGRICQYNGTGTGFWNYSVAGGNVTVDSTSWINGTGAGYKGGLGIAAATGYQGGSYNSTTSSNSNTVKTTARNDTGGGGGDGTGSQGGGGGGFGGAGGADRGKGGFASDNTIISAWVKGGVHSNQSSGFPLEMGGGGGAGRGVNENGGGGGGGVKINVTTGVINILGNITVNGTAGILNEGGGGAGGEIILSGQTINRTLGKLIAMGGHGSAIVSGGGGGGGRIKIFQTNDYNTSATLNVAGGGSSDATPGSIGTTWIQNVSFGETTPPTYTNNGTNNTNPAPLSQVLYYTLWADETGLSGYIFSWNATGALCNEGMVNDTWVAFGSSTSPQWSNVTKQAPLACAGKTIDFIFYANDTSNNWNLTGDMFENETQLINQPIIIGINSNQIIDKRQTDTRNLANSLSSSSVINRLNNYFRIDFLSSLFSSLSKGISSLTRELSSSLNLNSLSSSLQGFGRTAQEQLGISQLNTLLYSLERILIQSINSTQLIVRAGLLFQNISESFLLTVSSIGNSIFKGIASQGLSLDSLVNSLSSFVRALSQQLDINNLIKNIYYILKTIEQSISLDAISAEASTIFRTISDQLSFINTIERFSIFTRNSLGEISSYFSNMFSYLLERIGIQPLYFNLLISRVQTITKILQQSFIVSTTALRVFILSRVPALPISFNFGEFASPFYVRISEIPISFTQISLRMQEITKILSDSINLIINPIRNILFGRDNILQINLNIFSNYLYTSSLQLNYRIVGLQMIIADSLMRTYNTFANIPQSLSSNSAIQKIMEFFRISSIQSNINQALEKLSLFARELFNGILINNLVTRTANIFKIASLEQIFNSFSSSLSSFFRISTLQLLINDIIETIQSIFKNIPQQIMLNNLISSIQKSFRIISDQLSLNNLSSRILTSARTSISKIQLAISNLFSYFITRIEIQTINFNAISSRIGLLFQTVSQSININSVVQRIFKSITSVAERLSLNSFAERLTTIFRISRLDILITSVQSRTLSLFRQLTQPILLNQIVSRLSESFRQIANSLTLSNLSLRLANLLRISALQESFNSMQTFAYSLIRNIVQILNLNAILTRIENIGREISQGILFNSFASRIQTLVRTLSEALNMNIISERMAIMLRNLAVQLNFNTIVARTQEILKAVSEQLNMNNLATRMTSIYRTAIQSFSINTLSARISELFRIVTHSITANTFIQNLYAIARNIAQNINVNTITTRIQSLFKTISQSISLDSLSIRITTSFRNVFNQFSITNFISRLTTILRTSTLSLSLNSIQAFLYSIVRTPFQILQFNTLSTRIGGIGRIITDSLSFNMISERMISLLRAVSEGINFSLFAERLSGLSRQLYQQINIQAISERIGSIFRNIGQLINFNLIAERATDISRNILQNIYLFADSLRATLLGRIATEQLTFNMQQNLQYLLERITSLPINLFSSISSRLNTLRNIISTLSFNTLSSRIISLFTSVMQPMFINNLIERITLFARPLFQQLNFNLFAERMTLNTRNAVEKILFITIPIRNIISSRISSLIISFFEAVEGIPKIIYNIPSTLFSNIFCNILKTISPNTKLCVSSQGSFIITYPSEAQSNYIPYLAMFGGMGSMIAVGIFAWKRRRKSREESGEYEAESVMKDEALKEVG